MVHIGISADEDDIELLDAEVFCLLHRYGQERRLLGHGCLMKWLGATYTLRRQVGNRLQDVLVLAGSRDFA
jgi:hypothetical protein